MGYFNELTLEPDFEGSIPMARNQPRDRRMARLNTMIDAAIEADNARRREAEKQRKEAAAKRSGDSADAIFALAARLLGDDLSAALGGVAVTDNDGYPVGFEFRYASRNFRITQDEEDGTVSLLVERNGAWKSEACLERHGSEIDARQRLLLALAWYEPGYRPEEAQQ